MRYLVDTDWLIDALANRQHAIGPLRRFGWDGVAISVVTLGEVYEGAFGQQDPEPRLAQYRQFLDGFPVIPLNDAVMLPFGRITGIDLYQSN